MDHRRPSTTATIVGPSAVSGSAFSRKWRPPVQFLTSFPSTAAMSRRTARRRVQKGGVRGSDWPFARRKNEQNPCFGRRSRQTDAFVFSLHLEQLGVKFIEQFPPFGF